VSFWLDVSAYCDAPPEPTREGAPPGYVSRDGLLAAAAFRIQQAIAFANARGRR
jgi:hypothetical protein